MSEVCDECSGQCPSCGFDIDALRAENERLTKERDEAIRRLAEAKILDHINLGYAPARDLFAAEARVAELGKARRE